MVKAVRVIPYFSHISMAENISMTTSEFEVFRHSSISEKTLDIHDAQKDQKSVNGNKKPLYSSKKREESKKYISCNYYSNISSYCFSAKYRVPEDQYQYSQQLLSIRKRSSDFDFASENFFLEPGGEYIIYKHSYLPPVRDKEVYSLWYKKKGDDKFHRYIRHYGHTDVSF